MGAAGPAICTAPRRPAPMASASRVLFLFGLVASPSGGREPREPRDRERASNAEIPGKGMYDM